MVQRNHKRLAGRSMHARWISAGCLLLAGSLAACCRGGDALHFVTGNDLKSRLKSVTEWSCRDAPAAGQLQQFQELTGVAVVLDRRIDRDHALTLETGFVSRGRILGQFCDSLGDSGWSATDQLVYVGPRDAAARLPILLDVGREVTASLRGQLTSAAYRRLLAAQAVRWEILSEPRALVQNAVVSAGLSCDHPERVPHDVWDAAEWPPMPVSDQVTLILNQFDLMLCPGSSPASVDIVPVDPERLLTRSYRFNRSARDEVTQSCQRQFPTLKQHWVGNTLKVTAGLAQHIWLQTLWNQLDFAAPGDTPLPSDSLLSRNFSLRVERSTLGQLVEYFRTNGIRVEIVDADSREARRMLLTDVTLDLRSVPAEQFFSMVFGPYFERVTVEASRVVLQSPK